MNHSLLDMSVLLGAGVGLIILCFAISRVLRAFKHGFSIRLQLFFALFFISLSSTALIGFWAIYRIEARAVQLLEQSGLSTAVFQEFIKDFGLKTSVILGLITLIASGTAWVLGRGIAQPIERLAKAAKTISSGASIDVVPEPVGKEVRYLTDAFIEMHQTLEDRQRFENFITDLSHDLKNPVAAIKASSEVLLAGAANDEQTRLLFLNRIDEASSRLNRLLSDFLGLARLEARGITFDENGVSLPQLNRKVIHSFASLIESKQLQVEQYYYQRLEDDTLKSYTFEQATQYFTIKGHTVWLRRMLDNLLSNAIRYTPVQHKIKFTFLHYQGQHALLNRLFKVNPSEHPVHSHIMMWIEDEGVGVDVSIQDHLFERFMTDYHNPKGKTGGSGLGLAIVKRVTDAHLGKIHLLKMKEIQDIYENLYHQDIFKELRPLRGACFLLSFTSCK